MRLYERIKCKTLIINNTQNYISAPDFIIIYHFFYYVGFNVLNYGCEEFCLHGYNDM
jgi:hypothetical protein